MRPLLPPQLGLVLLAFCTLVTLALFGSTYATPAAQAQDTLRAAGAENVPQSAMLDFTVKISHSTPTYQGEAVTLTATVNITDASGLNFDWNFGDGKTARGQVVRHTYSALGVFFVRLVVSGKQNAVVTKTLTITVPPPPVVEAPGKVSIVVLEGNALEAQKTITFLATVDRGENIEFTWDFGDGSPSATGSTVSHDYALPNSYTVRVTARNAQGVSSDIKTITVRDASIEGLAFRYSPMPIMITASALFTATVERGTNVSYRWYISNGVTHSGRIFSYLFPSPGTYEIRVIASNPVGGAEYSQAVEVKVGPPDDVQLSGDESKNVGEAVVIWVFATSRAPVTIRWAWGDGQENVVPLTEAVGQRYQTQMTHIYNRAGKFPVVVTAYNESGSGSIEKIVYVDTSKHPQTLKDYEAPSLVLPQQRSFYRVADTEVDLSSCHWEFTDPLYGVTEYENRATVEHPYTRSGYHVVSINCRRTDNQANKAIDFVELVEYVSYLPSVSRYTRGSDSIRIEETSTPTNTPTATHTPTPITTPVAAVATGTATLPAAPTATPTFIATAPTATPTATAPFGSTIPQR